MRSALPLRQQYSLAITPKITSTLSIFSSAFIILEAYRDHKSGKGNAAQRALVGMSCVDLLASSGWFLSTWAVPEGTIVWAVGNEATCNYQGFLLQLAIGAPLYNCSLALYYLMVINFNWTNQMLKRIEWWVHGFVLTFSIGTSILLLPLQQYNHIETVCWVIGSPPDCGHSTHIPSDVPCDRGDWAWLYGIILFYGPLWICVVLTIIALYKIYSKVLETRRRMERYLAHRPDTQLRLSVISTSQRSAGMMTEQTTSNRAVQKSRQQKDVNRVATQAMLYSLSFFITWMPSTIWSLATWFGVHSFWLDYASAFCEPLQGFWNCMVFVYHRPSSRKRLRRLFSILFCGYLLCGLLEDPDRTASSSERRGSSALEVDRGEDNLVIFEADDEVIEEGSVSDGASDGAAMDADDMEQSDEDDMDDLVDPNPQDDNAMDNK